MQADVNSDAMSVVAWYDWEALKMYHGGAAVQDLEVAFALTAPPAAPSTPSGDSGAAAVQAAGMRPAVDAAAAGSRDDSPPCGAPGLASGGTSLAGTLARSGAPSPCDLRSALGAAPLLFLFCSAVLLPRRCVGRSCGGPG